MSAIRSRGNAATELRLITVFRAHGITGWRRGASLQRKVVGMKVKAFRVKPRLRPRSATPDRLRRRLLLARLPARRHGAENQRCLLKEDGRHQPRPRGNRGSVVIVPR